MKDIVEASTEDFEIFDRYPQLLDAMSEPDFEYDFEGCVTRISRDQPYKEIDVAMALLTTGGNLSASARLLNRSRRSVHNFVLRNHLLSDLLHDIEDITLDNIEAKARSLALAGDGSLIKYILGTKGKDRGFVQRVENTGKDGSPLNPVITYELPDNGRDTRIETKDNVVSITQGGGKEDDSN